MVIKLKGLDGAITGILQCEELEKVIIGLDEDKFLQAGTQLPPGQEEGITDFLEE